MEQLQYVVEDKTIAYLLGVNNFTNDESAVLELVKNAYDARALTVSLTFSGQQLTIDDNGLGMNENDIRDSWMHVGKSEKKYDIVDANNHQRILAGSKGIGRFALARLGTIVAISSKKENCQAVLWKTDWNSSTLEVDTDRGNAGTTITINGLREKWGKKKIDNLVSFLSKTYNDKAMRIEINHPDFSGNVPQFFPDPKLGINCLSTISIFYDSEKQKLYTTINSDEFSDKAQEYCPNINLKFKEIETDIFTELQTSPDYDLSEAECRQYLSQLGNFSGIFFFNIKPSSVDCEKFLYKYQGLPQSMPGGVILYRNAFSISAYEGKKDWLGFGKRSRKSPAAASHPTGSWRVRENQIAGKVEIDKKRNKVLEDLSNRQGLDENIFYQLFVDTILLGVKEFERYRQDIVRKIDVKNSSSPESATTPVSDKVVSDPKSIPTLSEHEAKQLAVEIKNYRQESKDARQEKASVEERYKYDIRILNVLATVGLKASSIAHEIKNDRNLISQNTEYIISALQEYGMWDEICSPERTTKAYKNIPALLASSKEKSSKIISFMDVMLSEIEKRQFVSKEQNIRTLLEAIKTNWENDYAWINISVDASDSIYFVLPEDILHVVFDNLILNSIQQNDRQSHLNVIIAASLDGNLLHFSYSDNGKGLDKKYVDNPRKILEVHETTRKNGHGLGMWIVNNTAMMSGGEIGAVRNNNGFEMEFSIGGAL
ncbi:MAG: sensor histidine kinase [Eubacteriales bacterium]|nr:sensor histidine kinase [Eubacteriales bacterium]